MCVWGEGGGGTTRKARNDLNELTHGAEQQPIRKADDWRGRAPETQMRVDGDGQREATGWNVACSLTCVTSCHVPDLICLTVACPGFSDASTDFDLWPLTSVRHFCPHGCRSPAIIACFVGHSLYTHKMVVSVGKSQQIPADSDLQPVWHKQSCLDSLHFHYLTYCHAYSHLHLHHAYVSKVSGCCQVIGRSAADRVWWTSGLQ